jgi:hypothetical protein
LHQVTLNPLKPKLVAFQAFGFTDSIAQQDDAIADAKRNRYGVKAREVE